MVHLKQLAAQSNYCQSLTPICNFQGEVPFKLRRKQPKSPKKDKSQDRTDLEQERKAQDKLNQPPLSEEKPSSAQKPLKLSKTHPADTNFAAGSPQITLGGPRSENASENLQVVQSNRILEASSSRNHTVDGSRIRLLQANW